jgi:hypothetical protein
MTISEAGINAPLNLRTKSPEACPHAMSVRKLERKLLILRLREQSEKAAIFRV